MFELCWNGIQLNLEVLLRKIIFTQGKILRLHVWEELDTVDDVTCNFCHVVVIYCVQLVSASIVYMLLEHSLVKC